MFILIDTYYRNTKYKAMNDKKKKVPAEVPIQYPKEVPAEVPVPLPEVTPIVIPKAKSNTKTSN
ncbi:MAG: hypothetical protein IPO21_18150 [Bacteroidales bacterium]|nr:hypothetical protein [Bacteroidales bacterium]